MLGIEPGPAGWEAQTLPLCCADPSDVNFTIDEVGAIAEGPKVLLGGGKLTKTIRSQVRLKAGTVFKKPNIR
jgi:hypothetical protein